MKNIQKFQLCNSFKITDNDLWALDRIDQFILPLDNTYRISNSGSGVDVCILDTGIFLQHIELSNRVFGLYDYRQDLDPIDKDYLTTSSPFWCQDDYGHGTHLASVVGGLNTGVAKGVSLHSVKVFDRNLNTTPERLTNGLNAVLNFHTTKLTSNPTICLLPWIGLDIEADFLETLIQSLYIAGVHIIGSGGNEDKDANLTIPAKYSEVIAVGGFDKFDKFMNPTLINDASFNFERLSNRKNSNFGSAIDILAPGFRVKGAWIADNYSILQQNNFNDLNTSNYQILSGNSVAAAVVAGVAALYLDLDNTLTPLQLKNKLISTSIKNQIQGLKENTPNRIVRVPAINNNFFWVPSSGMLFKVAENFPVDFTIEAFNKDKTGNKIKGSFSVISGSLPSTIILEENGKFFGTAPEVSAGTPGYILVSSLPTSTQASFGKFEKGFVDFNFIVKAENPLGEDINNFYIRVFDLNQAPNWDYETGQNLNIISSNSAIFYQDAVSIDLSSLMEIEDPNNDNITFSLLNGQLPPGLSLSSNGIISGSAGPILPELNYPSSAGTIAKTFNFAIRATDGVFKTDKSYNLTISRDSSNNSIPIFQNSPFSVSSLGEFYQGLPFKLIFVANDPDGDKVEYHLVSSVSISGAPLQNQIVPPSVSSVFYGLPSSIKLLTTGTAQGVLTLNDEIGTYYFEVDAYDGWDIKREGFSLVINEIDASALGSTLTLSWITPEGLLGNLKETFPSYFITEASVIPITNLEYSIVSGLGTLPPGLSINQNTGQIEGVLDYVSSSSTYTFVVKANIQSNPLSFITREFSINVEKVWGSAISYFGFNIGGDIKLDWFDKLYNAIDTGNSATTIITKENFFLPDNENFGQRILPNVYIGGGYPALNDTDLFNTLNVQSSAYSIIPPSYFAPIKVRIGDLKLAVARDENNNIVYEVLYYELYDQLQYNEGLTEDGIPDLIPNDDLTSPVDYFYPPSINNWRKLLSNSPGYLNDEERLPIWMTCLQDVNNPNSRLGFIPCIELLYVKPNIGQKFLNILQFRNNGLIRFGQELILDRFVYADLTDPNNIKLRQVKFPPGDRIV